MPLQRGVFDWLMKLGLLSLASTQQIQSPETRYYDDRGGEGKTCTVFTDMNKAAGTTIKGMLTMYSAVEGLRMGNYTSTQYLQGAEGTKFFLDEGHDVIAGSFTEGLRSHSPRAVEDCAWFTMFRHPIPRLVSAYFYCKGRETDQLCGPGILNATTTDLHTFAEHWRSFGMLQFVYPFIDQTALLDVEIDPELCLPNPCPAWYRARMYIENLFGADRTPTDNGPGFPSGGTALARFLEPVEKLLGTKYAAVGLVENWKGSMLLFDRALRLPNYNWTLASANAKSKNHNKLTVEEHELLQSAWTDPVIERFLWLDILLYDHAVRIHKKQLKNYGLK